MVPARAPARKTAQRGGGASSGTPATCGAQVPRCPGAQVRRCAGAQVRGPYLHRICTPGPDTRALDEAALRLRYVRNAGGRHAHPVCAAWLRYGARLNKARHGGDHVLVQRECRHRDTDLQRRGESRVCHVVHTCHTLCNARHAPICHAPEFPWRCIWRPSHTISNYLKLSQSDLKRR